MSGLIVIPARWNSRRLPGKPLQLVAGHTLLSRAIDLAKRATRKTVNLDIVVATDDPRVVSEAERHGCASVMTDAGLSSGSGRALAAARYRSPTPSLVVNLQGDSPFIPAGAIGKVIEALRQGAQVATPIVQLGWTELDALREHKRTAPFSGTTCVVGASGDALWFSKQVVPAIRDEELLRLASSLSPVHRHLGLYGYTVDALSYFEAAPPSTYERLEGLEQLRFLELGLAIRTVKIEPPPIPVSGIDTPEDVIWAERLIAAVGDPFGT